MTRVRRAAAISFLGAIAAPMPTMVWAEAPAINHDAVGCIVVDKFPRLEARFDPAENVSRGRLRFRPTGGAHWYSVPMMKEAEAFVGVLPKPTAKLKSLDYYVEVTATDFATGRTQEYVPEVVSGVGACQGDKITAGSLGSASIILEVPAGAPAVPAGFSSVGIVSATAAASAAAAGGAGTAAGGGVSTAVVVAGVVAAGAAVAGVAAASGGGSDGRGGTTTTTLAPAPATTTPAPPTTAPPAGLTGRWVGLDPDGMVVEQPICAAAFDLTLDLAHSGSTLTGSCVVRTRAVNPNPTENCTDRVGDQESGAISGTVGAGTVAFACAFSAGGGAINYDGTYTSTRMSGTWIFAGSNRTHRWSVNRQ